MKTQDIVEAPAAVLAPLRERRRGDGHGWHDTGWTPKSGSLLDLCLVARHDGTEGFGGVDQEVPAVGDLDGGGGATASGLGVGPARSRLTAARPGCAASQSLTGAEERPGSSARTRRRSRSQTIVP